MYIYDTGETIRRRSATGRRGYGAGWRRFDVRARQAQDQFVSEPTSTVLSEDGTPVGACLVQPRDPLPDGAFVSSVMTGLLPLEEQFTSVPGVGEPAAEALFIDPDPPDTRAFSVPYGVALLFTKRGRSLADRFRDAYNCPRGTETRPEFDPYGL